MGARAWSTGVAGLALALAGACSPAAPAERREPRVLVVGWDGATFDLLDPLLRAGALPNVARLVERGRTAVLDSTIVPISSAAWVGAVTGGTPGTDGVYDFFEPVADSYDVRLTSALSNRLPPLWRILGWQGLRSVVFGVPLTWPPEEIEGVMVTGMLSPFDATYTWPPELADELRGRGFQPDLGIWREDKDLTSARMMRQLAIKRRAVLEQLDGDWDFAMVVFKSLDVLSHRVYDGDPDGAVAHWMIELDRVLGDLLDAVGPDVNVLLVSDHGFHAYPRNFFTEGWLLEAGHAVARGPEAEAAVPGGPLVTFRAAEYTQRIAELDLARTVAFAGSAEGNFGGIRLNLAGREPRGIVAPERADALLAQLESELRALVIPGTGAPLVTNVYRGPQLYPGPAAGILPDLLFETDPSVAVRATHRLGAFAQLQGTFPDHARAGILVCAGPSIAPSASRGRADIADLAPTVLHLLGLPVHREMQGRACTELLSVDRAVRSVSGAELATGRTVRFLPAAAGEDPEVLRSLEGLGYLEGLGNAQDR